MPERLRGFTTRRYIIHVTFTFIYIFIHHQDGSTVDISRLNKICNLIKKQRYVTLHRAAGACAYITTRRAVLKCV